MPTRSIFDVSRGLVLLSSLLGGLTLLVSTVEAARPPDPGTIVVPPRDATPNRCEAPLGKGISHNSSNIGPVWTAADSPHIVPYDLSIIAPLTIQACAVVRIAPGAKLSIQGAGALTVAGTAGYPVIIQPQAVGMEWGAISNYGGVLSLSHAILAGGGVAPSIAMVQMLGNGTLHVDDVEIMGSRSDGVYLGADTGFDATSRNLRVHHSAGFPINSVARVIGTIPTGTYLPNGRPAIAIKGSGGGGPVINAQTLHNRGVPYHIGNGAVAERLDISTQVNGTVVGPLAMLTVEPGVIMLFPPGGELRVNANGKGGALVAIGTAAQPIVFTSDQGAASAAGNWLGINFNGPFLPQNVMQHVRVDFAGGPGTAGSNSCPYPGYPTRNDAAIRISSQPPGAFIYDSEIRFSAEHGIDRGWKGGPLPDFVSVNTFTSLARCKQTWPSPLVGNCPGSQNPPQPVPCP